MVLSGSPDRGGDDAADKAAPAAESGLRPVMSHQWKAEPGKLSTAEQVQQWGGELTEAAIGNPASFGKDAARGHERMRKGDEGMKQEAMDRTFELTHSGLTRRAMDAIERRVRGGYESMQGTVRQLSGLHGEIGKNNLLLQEMRKYFAAEGAMGVAKERADALSHEELVALGEKLVGDEGAWNAFEKWEHAAGDAFATEYYGNRFRKHMATMGLAARKRDVDYSEDAGNEIMNTEETVLYERYLEGMRSLDPNEMLQMTLEDKPFIDMLGELLGADVDLAGATKPGFGAERVDEFNPKTGEVVETDTYFPDPARYKVNTPIRAEKEEKLAKSMGMVRDFIRKTMSPAMMKDGAATTARRSAETFVWAGIVRNMDFGEKGYLIRAFFEEEEYVGDLVLFLRNAVATDLMTVSEIEAIMGAWDGTPVTNSGGALSAAEIAAWKGTGVDPQKFNSGAFLTELNLPEVAKEAEQYRKELQAEAENIKKAPWYNPAIKNLTGEKAFWFVVADLGSRALLVGTLAAGFAKAKSGSTWGEKITGFGLGFAESLTEPATGGALFATLVGTDMLMDGGLRNKLLEPGDAEKLDKKRQAQLADFREQVGDRPQYLTVLSDNFETWSARADRARVERGRFMLYPNDIKDEEVASLGGADDVQGNKERLRYLFNIAAVTFEVESKSDLGQFLEQTVDIKKFA